MSAAGTEGSAEGQQQGQAEGQGTTASQQDAGRQQGQNGAAAPDWMESAGLDADLRSNPSLTKFNDAASLAKSYVQLQKTVGAGRVALPTEDAPQAEWDAFFEQVGRPKDVNGYGLDEWKPPGGLPWNGEAAKRMIEKMHGHGLTTRQAKGLLNDFAGLQAETWENIGKLRTAQQQQADKELRDEFGSAYDAKLEAAKKAARNLVGESTDEAPNLLDRIILQDGRLLGDHPEIIKLFASIGERAFTEDSDSPLGGVRRTTATPEEASRELSGIFGDAAKNKILNDSGHPEHDALWARVRALQQQAFPEESR